MDDNFGKDNGISRTRGWRRGMLGGMNQAPDQRYLSWERRSEWPLTALAVAYLLAYAVPILRPDLSSGDRRIAETVMTLSWIAFAGDYGVRLLLADQRRRFVRRHLLDLLVICLPLLRPLRLLRLVMVLGALNRRIKIGFRGRVVSYVVGAVGLLTFVASLAVLDAERRSPTANITTYGDAIWWAFTTMTTVGYGDRFPTTPEGRLIAAGLMLSGVALLGVITAAVAAWFVEHVRQVGLSDDRAQEQLATILDELRDLREQLEVARLIEHRVLTSTRDDASAEG